MKKKRFYIVIILCLLCCLVAAGYIGNKFIKHELKQNEEIRELQYKVDFLKRQTFVKTIEWSDDNYNYLAIGNSITIHGYADYWWNDKNGMAASKEDTDYVHIIKSFLESKKDKVQVEAFSFCEWERLSHDRAETLTLLDNYLDNNINLITIQLGENATDLITFESDFEYLINYVKDKAPEAQIIVIGDFYEYNGRDQLKKTASNNCGVQYISLEKIKDNKDYQAGLGTIVYGDNGEKHIIEHEGVAKHPGDKGMKYIADKVIEKIQ